MALNTPSSAPSPLVPEGIAPKVTPDMVPQWGAERANVINTTKGALTDLAQQTFPLAAGLGVLGIMAYGFKMMANPEAPNILKKAV